MRASGRKTERAGRRLSFASALSLAAFLGCGAVAIELARGWRRLGRLAGVAADLPAPAPRVAIIVPARNEARAIEPALRSLAALEYPALEIVAIDDRSSDATGEILDRLAGELPALRVLHVRELPAGWLGKNHALHYGAANARGEYLLFTDADVVFEPSALARALAYCLARRLDHLTLVPQVPMRTRFLEFSMLAGIVGLLALFRPWRAERTGRHGMGIGAFNLVRAEAYRRAGGHQALAMEVVDDIGLGKLMATREARQAALLGSGMVSVEIYDSARAMLAGVQKNLFAFFDYRAWKLAAASAAGFVLTVWPWLGLALARDAAWWLDLAAAAAVLALHADLAPRLGYRRSCVIYLPIHGALSLVLLWQVAITTWLRGAVVWRGTRYPLAELKAWKMRTPGS